MRGTSASWETMITWCSSGAPAAVAGQAFSGDETCLCAGEEHQRFGNILGLAEASDAQMFFNRLNQRTTAGMRLWLDQRGLHVVDRDAVRPQVMLTTAPVWIWTFVWGERCLFDMGSRYGGENRQTTLCGERF